MGGRGGEYNFRNVVDVTDDIVPWGTPESTVLDLEPAFSYTMRIVLLVRKYVGHTCSGPIIPNCFSL